MRIRRTAAALAAATVISTGSGVALTAPAHATTTVDPCTTATLKLAQASLAVTLACTAAAVQAGANPLTDVLCAVATINYAIALANQNQACSAQNSTDLTPNNLTDPSVTTAILNMAGDTNPAPGDVADTSVVFDGFDGTEYVYSLAITGYETAAQFGGGGDPGANGCDMCELGTP